MTGRFPQCCKFVVHQLEGGPQVITDSGGLTKYGISQRAFPDLDIATLEYEDVERLYLERYWIPMGCDILPEKWDLAVFDCAVNQGCGAATRLMQEALGAEVDGEIGPVTREAMRRASLRVLPLFLVLRLGRYQQTKGYEKYGRGWVNRLKKLSREIAGHGPV